MEACGKVSHICHKISEDISHLFKVSALIGKSIARDRYARAETASKEKFDGQYDVAHVKAKFRQQNAPDWLLVRLGEAITKRRQYIKYVREHRSRIDNDAQQWEEPDLPHVASPMIHRKSKSRRKQSLWLLGPLRCRPWRRPSCPTHWSTSSRLSKTIEV
jgi:hypothetical protein